MRSACIALFALIGTSALAFSQTGSSAPLPPRSWVDKDTGHRVLRLTDEPNSGAFYFNINAYTPDGNQMVYTSAAGIHVLDMATLKTKLLVANPPNSSGEQNDVPGSVHAFVAGFKTNCVFYTRVDPVAHLKSLYKVNTNTGEVRKLVDLPVNRDVVTINADETLAAGTYIEGDATGKEYGSNLSTPGQPAGAGDNRIGSAVQGPHYQPMNKSEMMEKRLASRLPLVLFTMRLEPGPNGEKPGETRALLHSTDWVNHLMFSPSDPSLLMYCHEGFWHKVDRIWTIRTDGSQNKLVHKRTMANEVVGHEFWAPDGKSIWYDWQYPMSEDFFLAGVDVKTGERTAYHMQRKDWSIHFNVAPDLELYTGDGADPAQGSHTQDAEWIELLHPERFAVSRDALNEPSFWQPGVFHSERLVNMSHHYYRQEPNVRFSPDKKLVLFTSNMFGPSYVFAVEVEKTIDAGAEEIVSTPELARKFNPIDPPDSRTALPSARLH